jgi:hypothetical protein
MYPLKKTIAVDEFIYTFLILSVSIRVSMGYSICIDVEQNVYVEVSLWVALAGLIWQSLMNIAPSFKRLI